MLIPYLNALYAGCILLFISSAINAAPLTPEKIPEPLKPWVDWVLHDDTERSCPYQYNQRQRACRWPSRLTLKLDDSGGTFTQQWQVFTETHVRLPGDNNNWPQSVSNEQGENLLVEEKSGFPSVKLTTGIHTLKGRFIWRKLPRSLRVTPESGLITLQVNSKTIDHPNVNQQGQLWLTQGKTAAASEDNLDIQVFRKIIDTHPIQVVTAIKLRVSGKQRNATLKPVLLDGFIPLTINSALPARIEGQQQLQLQLRPGEWTVQVTGRLRGDTTQFTLPASQEPWPQQEVWVLESDHALRQIEVSGVNSIDPNQTRLPNDWKALPAYLIAPQQTLKLDVIQRGAAQTGKQKISLQREMWLDFDGAAYTLKDQLNGNIQQQTRLNVLPELALGRVSINGEPQFITRKNADSPAGIEIRRENLRLDAESRYLGAINHLPVSGWDQDLHSVDTTLHLPPGWQLFAVSGTDNQPNSWIQSWSLLDLFLVLVIALGTGYLFGWLWAGFALLALVFTWHENEAPQFIWLNLLAVIAMLSVLPEGWLKKGLTYYRGLSLLGLALIILPYTINTIRLGLYPQLERQHSRLFAEMSQMAMEVDTSNQGQADQADGMMPQPAPAPTSRPKRMAKELGKSFAGKPAPRAMKKQKYDMKAIDPNSMIQTGPGLPSWQSYQAIRLHWSGPVKADEHSRLFLINPPLNLLLKLLGIILLAGLSWRMLGLDKPSGSGLRQWFSSRTKQAQQTQPAKHTAKMLPVLLLPFMLLSHEPAQAETIPDQQTLQTLRERLTAAPDCLPNCAQIEHMQITLGGNTLHARLKVHAAIATTIPLPGSQDTWLAEAIRIDYRQAQGIKRDDRQQLWLAIPAGQHEVELRGFLPARNSIPLPLPLKPHFVSWESMDKQWALEGIRDNGTAESQLQLNRVLNENEKTKQDQQQSILPTFIKVERQLHLGLDWHVETIVRRLAPLDTPLSLNIPLLPNEQPMSEKLSIKNQQIKINFAAQQNEIHWSSRLDQRETITLEAASTADYLESWKIAASPVWHVEATGLPVNQFKQQNSLRTPVWLPWPGEKLILTINRPQGVPGQTITLLGSQLDVQAGQRANTVTLDLTIRSSRGVQHAIQLPAEAQVQSLTIDGTPQRIQNTQNKLNLTLKPGQQQVQLQWRETSPIGLRYIFPQVDLRLPAVNAQLSLQPPQDRWILWTYGPTYGPAILFWGVLFALLLVALALGYSRLTPLKSWQWFLLGVGLSQTETLLMVLVASWLIAIAWREGLSIKLKHWQFNTLQVALAGLTLISLLVLTIALSHGLLGQPEMQIAGNDSTSYQLNWYQDRSDTVLPQPSILSVPLWVYRVLMLFWALWLAVSVLKWLRWEWKALNVGGLWQKKPLLPKAPTHEQA